jgi:hypothetical protein
MGYSPNLSNLKSLENPTHVIVVCKFLCVLFIVLGFSFLCVKMVSLDSYFHCKWMTILCLNMVYHSRYFHLMFCMRNYNNSCRHWHGVHIKNKCHFLSSIICKHCPRNKLKQKNPSITSHQPHKPIIMVTNHMKRWLMLWQHQQCPSALWW